MSTLTRSAMLLLALAALLCLARTPARAQESSLAHELSMLRQSWLHDDDATAIARLETLRRDNRLSGQLPRWLAAMRAALALNAGDTETAGEVLQPLLDQTQDAREHVRAIRLALAFGHNGLALEFARHGRARAPQSTVLATLEAELLLLQGDTDGALAAWRVQTGADPRPAYPHVPPHGGGWANVRPWNVALDAVRPAPPADDERAVRRKDSAATPGYSPEPFVSLFMPVHWYSSVQPGLDRCLHELAANPAAVATREAALETLCEAAQQAQKRFENFRGELAERAKLATAAAEARFDAVCAVRIVAQHQLAMAQSEKAESTARMALAFDPDNIACNDLLAQAYAGQGKAEEARVGPLGRLKASAGLNVSTARMYTAGPYGQAADRVFAPALALYRVNGQAGRDQFKKLRASFGDPNNENGIPAEALGLWLFLKGENGLARELLREASNVSGADGGKTLSRDTIITEFALAQLGEPTQDELAPGDSIPDGDLALPIRNARRVGQLISACADTTSRVEALSGVSIWGSSPGTYFLMLGADAMPQGRAKLAALLHETAGNLASTATREDLAKALDPAHAESRSLLDSFKGLADNLESLRGNDNWRTRQAVGQQAGPVFGKLEARALLLRAKLAQDAPADLKSLATWLAANQGSINARALLRTPADDAYAREQASRTEAAIPEVVHADLLLDAALLLARKGHFADAARLLWLNRNASFGASTASLRYYLGSLLARKAGNSLLEGRFRLLSTLNAGESYNTTMDLSLCELPSARERILEFFGEAEVREYVQLHLIVSADTAATQRILEAVPEMKTAPRSLLLRNPVQVGTDGIFESIVTSGSGYALERAWAKVLISSETPRTPARLLFFVLASDFNISANTRYHTGIAESVEVVRLWRMLLGWHKCQPNDPRQVAAATKLAALLERIGQPAGEMAEYYYEYWE